MLILRNRGTRQLLFIFIAICTLFLYETFVVFRSRRRQESAETDTDTRPAQTERARVEDHRYLPICVPHAARPNNVSYLRQLLGSLGTVEAGQVLIADADGGCDRPECVAIERQRADCVNVEKVECVVQQAALDVVQMLHVCVRTFATNDWLLIIEDDMTACRTDTIDTIDTILRSEHLNKTAVYFFSTAFTAFAINRNVVHHFTDAVLQHIDTTPFDHILWEETWASPLQLKKHSRTLFHHEGKVSSIDFRNDPDYVKQHNQEGSYRFKYCGSPID
jgi:hypothetical protein